MMTQAFYTGISGIQSTSGAIDVTSNNLANISTPGFRGYTTEFASLFENAINTPIGFGNSVGVGSRVQASSMNTTQGSLALSDRSTDMAIMGSGWFGVQGQNEPVFTRNGAFGFDENSDLVTTDGNHVLGTMGNNISPDNILTQRVDEIALGDIGAQEKLRFPKTLAIAAEPSTQAKFIANLGTGAEGFEIITIGASVIDPQNNRNNLRLEFSKSELQNPPGSQWDVIATTQSLDGETIYDTQTGRVEFTPEGALSLSTLATIDNNGAPIAIDLGEGFDGIVSVDTPVRPGSSMADGMVGGELEGYSINKNGEVLATFSNGKQSSVGKIAVYHFANEQGLERISGTNFKQSSNSGEPLFLRDAQGNNITGTNISNFRLESSNVDFSAGLTNLIMLQRSFDANSKSITTADQMMQKALNMDA